MTSLSIRPKDTYCSLWQQIIDSVSKENNTKQFLNSFTSPRSFATTASLIEEYVIEKASPTLLNIMHIIKDFRANEIELKNQEKSAQLRVDGNEQFKLHNWSSALHCYSQSLMHATNAKERGIIYGNISALHFQNEQYFLSLKSIRQSFQENYPKDDVPFLTRLIERVKKCLAKLTPHSPIDSMIQQQITNDPLNYLNSIIPNQINFSFSSSSRVKNYFNKNISISKNDNEFGHCLIAINNNLEVGDLLLLESPQSSSLTAQFSTQRCFHCFADLTIPLACETCSHVLYCSTQCKFEAEKIHQFECQFMFLMRCIGAGHLAWRSVICNSLFPSPASSHDHQHQHSDHLNSELNYNINDLVSHLNDVDSQDLFAYALTAWLLSQIALHCDFVKNENERKAILPKFLCSLLQIQCNAHAIISVEESLCNSNDLSSHSWLNQERVGVGFYPLTSLMNHSCEPNVFISFINQTLCAKLIRPISSGEQILTCYGPHYIRSSTKQRQEELLNQYYFTCSCEHCTIQHDFHHRRSSAWICWKNNLCHGFLLANENDEMRTCSSCGYSENSSTSSRALAIQGHIQQFQKGLLNKNDYQLSLEALNCLSWIFHPDVNIQLGEMKDELAHHLISQGDLHLLKEALDLCQSSLEIVKNVYGENSVELLWESCKFYDLLKLTKKPLEEQLEMIKELIYLLFHPKTCDRLLKKFIQSS